MTARTDAEADDAIRQFILVARTGRLDEIGALVYGSFAVPARRRFSPTWTSADIVRFVAGFRSSSTEAANLVSPLAAENQLRGVLGEKHAARPKRRGLTRSSCCSAHSPPSSIRKNWITS